jgi:D-alanine--poly(phosphoribitol) ligase subunit 2
MQNAAPEQSTTSGTHRDAIEKNLLILLSDILNVEVSPSTDLFETGVLDSQLFVELLLKIEQHFGTEILIEDFDFENFRCVEKMADLIFNYQDRRTRV